MTKKNSGLRAALATVAVDLACTSCSAFATTTKPTVQPAPTAPAAPAASASAAVTKTKAPSRQPSGRDYLAKVDDYCRSYYVAQRTANDRYPKAAGDRLRSLFLAAQTRRLLGRQEAVRVPSAEALEVHRFERNEQGLVRSFTEEARGDASAGDAAYNEALSNRHDYGTSLGARECDGLLPHVQAAAAASATRRFDLTTDPHEGCVSLEVLDSGDTFDQNEVTLQDALVLRLPLLGFRVARDAFFAQIEEALISRGCPPLGRSA